MYGRQARVLLYVVLLPSSNRICGLSVATDSVHQSVDGEALPLGVEPVCSG
jgi:hypothetical protein